MSIELKKKPGDWHICTVHTCMEPIRQADIHRINIRIGKHLLITPKGLLLLNSPLFCVCYSFRF